MKSFLRIFIGTSLTLFPVLVVFVSPVFAAQATLQKMLYDTGATSTLTGSSQSWFGTIGSLINVFLSLLGVLFLLLILRAGLLYMTSQGEQKAITKAKDTMITAVIGLVIILSAYAISGTVIGYLGTATGG